MKKNIGKNLTRLSIIAILSFELMGCSLIRPDGPVARLNIHSVQYLNPDVNGNASPVVVTVYQLKTPYAFQQATYDGLSTNSGQVLGTDLIDRSTLEVRPSSDTSVNQSLSPNTQYLGIVADYRNIGQAAWRQTVPVTNVSNKESVINLDLESQALIATVTGTSGTGLSL